MTSPGRNEEIASLLLRVAVDYQALEEFVSVLPGIPDALEAVSARINATEIGNAAIFREKGAALTRAVVAGLQGEAAGLQLGNIGERIVEQIFGGEALGVRQIQDYVTQVNRILGTIRAEVPQATRDLISPNALRGLENVAGGAAQARREVEALSGQLGMLRAEMASLQFTSSQQLPKQLVRAAASGDLEFTPGARTVLQNTIQTVARPFGAALPDPNDFAVRNRANTGINLAATNRELHRVVQSALSDGISRLADQVIPNVRRFTEVLSTPTSVVAGTAVADSLRQVSDSAERTARALDRVTQAAEQVLRSTPLALAPGTGAAPTTAAQEARNARLLQRLTELNSRVDQRLVIDQDPVGRGTIGLPSGQRVGVAPAPFAGIDRSRVAPPYVEPSGAVLDSQAFNQNWEVLYTRYLNAQANDYREGIDPASLQSAMANVITRRRSAADPTLIQQDIGSFQQMMVGRGAKLSDLRGLSEEDFTALNGGVPTSYREQVALLGSRGRFFPPGLATREDIASGLRGEFERDTGNLIQPKVLASPADLENTRRRQRILEQQARFAAAQQTELALGRARLAITGGALATNLPVRFQSPLDISEAQRAAANRARAFDFSSLPSAAQLANLEALRERLRAAQAGRTFESALGGTLRRENRPLRDLALREDAALRLQAGGGVMATGAQAFFDRQELQRPFGIQGRGGRGIYGSDPRVEEAYPGFFRNADGTRRRTGQINFEEREDLGGYFEGKRYANRSLLPPEAGGRYETNPLTGQEKRVRGYALKDGRGGGLIALSTGEQHAGFDRAATLAHELQHILPNRNPVRFQERKANPFSAGAEEARADAVSGRNARFPYPNTSGDPAWQQGYDFVHRRISEAYAYREAAQRQAMIEEANRTFGELTGRDPIANAAGGIPGAPPLQRGLPFGQVRANLEESAARQAANDARLRAAGIDPAEFRARADAISTAIPAGQLGGGAQAAVTAADQRQAEAASRAALALERLAQAAAGTTGTRVGVAGPGGVSFPGGALVPTGIGRGIPGIPGVLDLRAQREAIAAAERSARALPPPPPPPPFAGERYEVPGGRPFAGRNPYAPGGAFFERTARVTPPRYGFDEFGFQNALGGGAVPPGGFPPGGGGGGSGFPPPGPMGGGVPPGGGAFGAFFGGIKRGFLGRGEDTPGFLGASIGQAARFAVVYGAAYTALRTFSGGFSQAVQETIQFEQALTDLNIATERTGRSNEAFAQSLVNLGSGRGVGPGEAVAAGARAIGLFDATESARVDQEAIARQSVDTATKLAFLAPGTPVELIQTQVAGITRSFGIEALDQERVADVASFIGRRTGRPGAEILSSLGQIGSLGEAAGFDLEQVAAIIARLTSTTGQTPQAVSGFLSQVLSRANDPRLAETLRGVGVDTDGTTLAQQIEQLSQIDLTTAQKNQVVSGFGRGRSGQALGIILEQFPQIQALAGGAKTDSAGLANRDFEQAVNTVGGQLRVLAAEIKDLFVGLASSGLLDPLVALLSGIGLLVDALDLLVDTFNLIPREARTAAFALGSVIAALALFSRIGPGIALAARGGLGAAGLGVIDGVPATHRRGRRKGQPIFDTIIDEDGIERQEQRTRREFLGTPFERAKATGGAAVVAGRTAVVGRLAAVGGTAVGGAVAGALGVSAAAAGGIILGAGAVLAGAIYGVADAVLEAGRVQDLITESGIAINTARTPDELDSALRKAQESKKAAEERDDFKLLSNDAFTLGIPELIDGLFGFSGDQRRAVDAQIEQAEARQKELAERDQTVDPFTVLGGFSSVEGVADGLKQLTERGMTAAQQLDVLNGAFDALLATTGESGAAAVLLKGQGAEFADIIATDLLKAADAQQVALQREQRAGGANGFAGVVADAFRSTPIIGGIGIGGIIETLAGAAGGFAGAGGNIFTSRIPGAIRGGLDQAGEALQEGLPFLQSDREQAEENAELAGDLRKRLADPDLRKKLSEGVISVLNERGINPTDGPVSLGPEDVEAIKERQRDILEQTLGKEFTELPKEVQEAQINGRAEAIQASVEGFAGQDVTAANGRAYLDSVRALAAKAGGDVALTTGSELQGAEETVNRFLEGRTKITDSVAKIDADLAAATDPKKRDQLTAERERQMQLLAQYDLDIQSAIKQRTAAARADIQSLVDLDKSLLKEGDIQGQIAADLSGIAQQLALPNLSDTDRRGLEAQQNRLNQQAATDVRRTAAVHGINHIDPGNTFAVLEREIVNAQAELDAAPTGSLAFEEAQRALNQLNESRERYLTENALSVVGVFTNPNNAGQAARDAVQRAQIQYDAALANGNPNDINAAVAGLSQARFAERDQQINRFAEQNSFRNFTDPGSGLQAAADELYRAEIDIQRYDKDTAEWFAAQRRFRNAQIAYGDAVRDLGQVNRRLGSDLTNPLEQAMLDLQDTTDDLNSARARNAAPDTIAALELQQRQGQNTVEQVAFNQRMEDFRVRNQLGEITDSAYIDFLNAEKARLEAIRDKSFQQQQFLNEVNLALLGLNDQLQGQFNLGDIDVPAPFEARRLLATPGGGGAQAITTVNLTINGGDMNQVRGVVAQYLGPVALSKTPTVTPTRI